MTVLARPGDRIAVAPLVGNQQTEEAHWLGALLGRLLAEHLVGAGLPVLNCNLVTDQIVAHKHRLPLSDEAIASLKRELKLDVLIHGRYVLDEDAKMLGLRLLIESSLPPSAPLEAASPVAGFSQFVGRISLALVEQCGTPVDDSLRQRVQAVPRPASFEAFRQLAQANLAWSKGQNQLALAAVASALALDPQLDEAAAIEVAIARSAEDTATTREAFRRWAAIATKQSRPLAAANRLMMLGHWLTERGEWVEARRAYEDARNLFQAKDSEYGKAQVSNNLANLDMLSGKWQAAIQTYRRSLRVFETDPDGQDDTAATYFNLALAHKNLGQREEAERAIEEALLIARRSKDTRLEAHCLAQRGAIRDDMGQWGQADADYSQAARLLDVVGDEETLAIVRSHQGLLQRRQGAYDRAEALLLEALDVFEKGGDPHERAVIWFNLADLYLAMGLYEQAWDYAGRAHETFTQLKSGWTNRAKTLLETLKSIPKEAVEPQNELEDSVLQLPVLPEEGDIKSQISLPERSDPGESQQDEMEPLYDDDDLYDDE